MLKILFVGIIILLSGCVAPKVNSISLSYSYKEHSIGTSLQLGGVGDSPTKFLKEG